MKPFTHDQYAPLSHRAPIREDGHIDQMPDGAPTWLDRTDARRLAAYQLMAAMRDNVSRYYLPDVLWAEDPTDGEPPIASKVREYGHAGLLCDQARSLVLGDSQRVFIPEELTEEETGPDGEPVGPDPRIAECADWLGGWVDDERLLLKMLEAEENATTVGDGVYVLGWDEDLARPRLRVYDPGLYFPDLRDGEDADDYPRHVVIAWNYELRDGQTRTRLHRFRMREASESETRAPRLYADTTGPTLATCWYQVLDFDPAKLDRHTLTIYDITEDTGGVQTVKEWQDTRLDFMPVVHLPNDAAGTRHFGRSILMRVGQVLDDLAATDTDLQSGSELVGSAPMVTKGTGGAAFNAGPGQRHDLPVGGDAKYLDTSRNLDALLKYVDHLLETLSVNSRLAAALLGRVKPNEVPSGYALALGFAPTRSLIREMRLVRAEKYPLLLKFAMRMAVQFGALPRGPVPRAEIEFGAYLPADKAAAVEYVAKLLPVHGISDETAVRVLMDAGFPVDDAAEEVARIARQHLERIVAYVDATGDLEGARTIFLTGKLPAVSQAPPALPSPPPAPTPPTPPAP